MTAPSPLDDELREQILLHSKVTFDNYDKESRSARKLVTIPIDKLMQLIQRHRKGGEDANRT